MEANRAVVCGKSREVDADVVFDRVTTHDCGGKHDARHWCRAVAIALALQSLLL